MHCIGLLQAIFIFLSIVILAEILIRDSDFPTFKKYYKSVLGVALVGWYAAGYALNCD